MNVYQKDYSAEFIKSLPVNFNKMKNINLNEIPECYHCIFTTDWNWGKYSNMKMENRRVIHEIFLEYQHYKMLAMQEEKLSSTESENKLVGFIKD